ncbi:related to PH domain protein [Cephalotrichum gorgonifer]|uniref:Related to PH domain protein n=1 Tax=Cephalotrichum gorgonifer TaxID=2041049 RepID=A0AAE8MWB1_9PEZI|nr:related to PH domain protein [Cephalotrichum gorgonifer]
MATVTISAGAGAAQDTAPPRTVPLNTHIPVSQNGCFEFDRVIKSGSVQKRAQKTHGWKTVYLVLRPNTLSIYKNSNEEKLRHKIYLNDLTAAAPLRDPKNKRDHLFGLFLPSRNYHLQAPTASEAEEWLELIRKEARIDEEDEELFLASPVASRQSSTGAAAIPVDPSASGIQHQPPAAEWLLSSSPECVASTGSLAIPGGAPRTGQFLESHGLSGNELASHSDFSDNGDMRPRGTSICTGALAARSPPSRVRERANPALRPSIGDRNTSQGSGASPEQELDRVIWQGRLLFLRSKGGVRQWRKTWGVLRPRNLILYRDESEYAAKFILPLPSIVDVIDIDPIGRGKGKAHCLQIITDEKNYRFCAADEESLVQCLGAFKSLLTKRKELEGRVAAAAAAAGAGVSSTATTANASGSSVAAPASAPESSLSTFSTSPPLPISAHMVLPTR